MIYPLDLNTFKFREFKLRNSRDAVYLISLRPDLFPCYVSAIGNNILCIGGIVKVDPGVACMWSITGADAELHPLAAATGLLRIWDKCKEWALNNSIRRIQSIAEDTPEAMRINTIAGFKYEGRMASYYGNGIDGIMMGMLINGGNK